MRWIALLIGLSAASTAAAQDCTFENAVFEQPGAWTVAFQPLPRDAGASQTASFILTLRSGDTLTGRIVWPNGYSTPLWSLEGPCEAKGSKICQLTGDQPSTAYILTKSGIERFPEDMSGAPPKQILLPRLGSSIWYSFYRESEFAVDDDPGDVLSLAGCAG